MTTKPTAEERVKVLAKQMADLTRTKCGSCTAPLSCCATYHCEVTARYAKEEWDVTLKRTDHPTLPFMGPTGCTVEPHLRPLCTVAVCEIHYMRDAKFSDEYFALRDEYNTALSEREETKP